MRNAHDGSGGGGGGGTFALSRPATTVRKVIRGFSRRRAPGFYTAATCILFACLPTTTATTTRPTNLHRGHRPLLPHRPPSSPTSTSLAPFPPALRRPGGKSGPSRPAHARPSPPPPHHPTPQRLRAPVVTAVVVVLSAPDSYRHIRTYVCVCVCVSRTHTHIHVVTLRVREDDLTVGELCRMCTTKRADDTP